MIQPQLVPRPPVTDQGCPVRTFRTARRALMVVLRLCHASNVVVGHGNDGKVGTGVGVGAHLWSCFLLHVVNGLRVLIRLCRS